ncbi:UBN2_3 domain-containing protein [Cephalotus follicularis]|uniref:UBN2_3 domain-containing protein n=1 Tax=Cephalotus follicularis TaxID=3775 RepID=A0A1Q3CD81_CEPFO|nr:UBN2_3 domain-containing protein [Cephalotus follicularis]
MVMSWLLHFIEHDIWDSIARQYSQRNNHAEAYEIRQKIRELKQGELSLATYYSAMTYLWQQLDSYRTFRDTIASNDLIAFQSDIEKERVYDFLRGLNLKYDPIHIQILGRESFPTLEGAYNLPQHEERRRNAMMPSVSLDCSAHVVSSRSSVHLSDSKSS